MKVSIDLRRPMRRCCKIKVEGDISWLPITYDNLPNHCVGCGRLAHDLKDCIWLSDEQKRKLIDNQPFRLPLRSDWGVKGFAVVTDQGGMKGGVRQRSYLAEGVETNAKQAAATMASSPNAINGKKTAGKAEIPGKNSGGSNDGSQKMAIGSNDDGMLTGAGNNLELNRFLSTPYRKVQMGLTSNGLANNTNIEAPSPMQRTSHTKEAWPDSSQQSNIKEGKTGQHSTWKRRARAVGGHQEIIMGSSVLGKRSEQSDDSHGVKQEGTNKGRRIEHRMVLGEVTNVIQAVAAGERHRQEL